MRYEMLADKQYISCYSYSRCPGVFLPDSGRKMENDSEKEDGKKGEDAMEMISILARQILQMFLLAGLGYGLFKYGKITRGRTSAADVDGGTR